MQALICIDIHTLFGHPARRVRQQRKFQETVSVFVGDLVIGMDVGTTTVKSAAFRLDDLSLPVAVERRSSVGFTPRPNWSEANPAEVEEAAFGTVRDLVASVGAERVAGIGISGTACGAWLVADGFRSVRPAILWNDGRAAVVTARWSETGLVERIFDISGNVPFPGYTLPVLAWLAENEADSLDRATAVLCCKDWLRGRLTGSLGSDETDASYVPFDITNRTWSDELLELTGLARHRRLLPSLLAPASTELMTAEGAARTGLLRGTPVAVGATDIVAGLVGAGATAVGGTVTILGTSANSTIVADTPPWDPRNVGIMAASPLGRYARSLINTSGSATLDWGARLLAGGDVPRFLALAAAAPEGAGGLVFVPYLSPAGTVSPRVDANATGRLHGLRVHHGPAEVARAVLEGLALAVADCYTHMGTSVKEITAVGGAARSDVLLSTLADLTRRPVVRLAGDEFGARGVALLAAWAIGAVDDLDAAASRVAVDRRFEPRSGAPMGDLLDRYQAISALGSPA
jgi:sugar (pentulose or hexulose) kinase